MLFSCFIVNLLEIIFVESQHFLSCQATWWWSLRSWCSQQKTPHCLQHAFYDWRTPQWKQRRMALTAEGNQWMSCEERLCQCDLVHMRARNTGQLASYSPSGDFHAFQYIVTTFRVPGVAFSRHLVPPLPLHHGLSYHVFLARLSFSIASDSAVLHECAFPQKGAETGTPKHSQLEATASTQVFYHSSHLPWDSFLPCLRFPGSFSPLPMP